MEVVCKGFVGRRASAQGRAAQALPAGATDLIRVARGPQQLRGEKVGGANDVCGHAQPHRQHMLRDALVGFGHLIGFG